MIEPIGGPRLDPPLGLFQAHRPANKTLKGLSLRFLLIRQAYRHRSRLSPDEPSRAKITLSPMF